MSQRKAQRQADKKRNKNQKGISAAQLKKLNPDLIQQAKEKTEKYAIDMRNIRHSTIINVLKKTSLWEKIFGLSVNRVKKQTLELVAFANEPYVEFVEERRLRAKAFEEAMLIEEKQAEASNQPLPESVKGSPAKNVIKDMEFNPE